MHLNIEDPDNVQALPVRSIHRSPPSLLISVQDSMSRPGPCLKIMIDMSDTSGVCTFLREEAHSDIRRRSMARMRPVGGANIHSVAND